MFTHFGIVDPRQGSQHRSLRFFARSRSGVAAVEFALILPVMLLIYFGVVEFVSAFAAQRKLTLAARSIADLVGRTTAVTNQELADIAKAADAIAHPFNGTGIDVKITSVVVREKPGGNAVEAVVCWGYSDNGAVPAEPPGRSLPTPAAGFNQANQSYVIATVSTTFKPAIGYALTGDIRLSVDSPAWGVRSGNEVVREGTPPCLPRRATS